MLGPRALGLIALYAAFPVIALLPNQIASIRLAGPSLLWWYGGVLAPAVAVLIAVAGIGGRRRLPGP